MPVNVFLDEYEPPITFYYHIPDGYVVKGYENIPAKAVKVICPYWWRIPKFREARYSLVAEGDGENISLPENAILSPMIGLEMDLHQMQYYVHIKVEGALVRQNGQPIPKGVLKPSALCMEAKMYATLSESYGDEDTDRAYMKIRCYLAPDGYTAILYLYDDHGIEHQFAAFEFKAPPLTYEALKEQLIPKVERLSDRKIAKFLSSTSNLIQFPATEKKSVNKSRKRGEKQ